MKRIVIIGAGQAGAALAARLRALGHAGPIHLIGAEPVAPYQRPPLSKAYLTGAAGIDRLLLRPPAFWADAAIALAPATRALAIDRAARRVLTDRAGAIDYDLLAICTGAAPRRLPAAIGGDLPGVHVLRDLADADRLARELVPGRRALIVGGGYVGLEAAAVARTRGLEVTLIEAAPRILARVACAETAAWFAALHRARGVQLLEGAGLARLTGHDRITGACLADGRHVPADLAIVGIGVTPRTDLAQAAGLAVDGGIVVDARGRTSDRAIFAAGDCTSLPLNGTRLRLESVQNAIDQAEAAAAEMLGLGADYAPVPWFWSDQYDVKLQIAGLNTGHDRVVVRQAAARSHWYFAGPRLLAVDAMNDARAYMVAKRLLEAGRSPDPATVANPEADLKALLA
jgi:3-phenylpropionate/trans-cinnamate dioxygenase ferredoxin reductase subunit